MSSCGNCRYYGDKRECHRYPPVLNPEAVISVFPVVTTKSWCGEWKGIPPCTCKEVCRCKELKEVLNDWT